MRSITTKVGDRGTTFLFSGEEVPKDSPRTMAYGDLDELVSALGLARCHVESEEIKNDILLIQRDLFTVGAELATAVDHVNLLKQRIGEAELSEFESRRSSLEARIRMPDGFIIPGGSGSRGAAFLDFARAIARRLERRAVRLQRAGLIDNRHLLIWLNRLSDYLWLLARLEEGESLSLRELRKRKDLQGT
ncbi:MAG: cob(I)yrinic acid a,c-diamide adenosyltransferase [Kiritimatiellae bacterium]|nr:cob(I)yrinic acid a,c-diamide adenosyltransferase [Kiritimatiellia bacterium]MDW8458937.1 cob(I)yrinic acid a,c-diamide adenosyltransferase [Verrucomicrobiota bacterium]